MSDQHADDRATHDALEDRLQAVERALSDGDHDLTALADAADLTDAITDLRTRVDDLEARVAELDAATQALRGYVGNVRSVDRDIERRADAALAKVERLEAELDGAGETGSEDASDARVEPASEPAASHGAGAEGDRTETQEHGRTASPDTAAGSGRCAHCGAAHGEGDAASRDSGRSRRSTTAATERDQGRPAADGGRDEWRELAGTDDDAEDADDGLVSSLRNAL